MQHCFPDGLFLVCDIHQWSSALAQAARRIGDCRNFFGPGGEGFPGIPDALELSGALRQAHLASDGGCFLQKPTEHVTEDAAPAAAYRADEDVGVEQRPADGRFEATSTVATLGMK